MLQAALFVGFSSAASILFVSRLFVFPYYIGTAIIVGVLDFLSFFYMHFG
ncbi:hypothetical protein [Psychrobacillus sp. L3]